MYSIAPVHPTIHMYCALCPAGATSPIARALCTALHAHGATVVLGCREPTSPAACELVQQLQQQRQGDAAAAAGAVLCVKCDLSSMEGAKACAEEFLVCKLGRGVTLR